jgi:hypothetical protein
MRRTMRRMMIVTGTTKLEMTMRRKRTSPNRNESQSAGRLSHIDAHSGVLQSALSVVALYQLQAIAHGALLQRSQMQLWHRQRADAQVTTLPYSSMLGHASTLCGHN